MSKIEKRVFGPPGTGKTTDMVVNATRAAETYGEDMVSIVSLTNTAVREAFGRDIPIDPRNITTLHSRCKRALNAPPPAESMISEFISSSTEWFIGENALPPYLRKGISRVSGDEDEEVPIERSMSGRGTTMYERAQIYRNQMTPLAEWNQHVREWYAGWSSWCMESGHMDFTGWMENCLRTKALPGQEVVFVDEAQDHTPLQLAVLRSWRTHDLIMVGDDDQNLYEWSGAIPEKFFATRIAPENERVLSQSYRIPSAVHGVADPWVRRISHRREKVYHSRDEVGKAYSSRYSIDNARRGDLPDGFLDDPNSTYMILASCGYLLDPVINILRSRGIAFHNPYRRSNKKWNPLDTPRERVIDYAQKGAWSGRSIVNWAGALGARSGAFTKGAKAGFIERCKEFDNLEVPYDIVRQAFTDQVFERIMRRDASIFSEFRTPGMIGSWDYMLDVINKGGDWKKPRVIIGTIHSVKGGEADVVYLMPDMSGAGGADYINRPDRVIRLFYVGMTRARQELALCSPSVESRHKISWGIGAI